MTEDHIGARLGSMNADVSDVEYIGFGTNKEDLQ